MNRVQVTSSNISSIGYDPEDRLLEFECGAIYQYERVEEYVYRNLMSAESHGTYFHAHIKGVYSYSRVNATWLEWPA